MKKKRNAEREADAATHIAECNEDRRRETHKVWLERGTLLAVVIYAGIAAWQGCLFRAANRISHDALYAQQRPWVGLDPANGGLQITPVSINAGLKAAVSYIPATKNFGNYPAERVMTFAQLVLLDSSGNATTVDSEQDKTCSMHVGQGLGDVVFPPQSIPAKEAWPSEWPIPPGPADRLFMAFVTGCVLYTDPFGQAHQTGFVYELFVPTRPFTHPTTFQALPNTQITGIWRMEVRFGNHISHSSPVTATKSSVKSTCALYMECRTRATSPSKSI
jgi:hypothetical protein